MTVFLRGRWGATLYFRILAIVLGVLSGMSGNSRASEILGVTGVPVPGALNVRSEPSALGKKLALLNNGDNARADRCISVRGSNGETDTKWCYVSIDPRKGWAPRSYFEVDATTKSYRTVGYSDEVGLAVRRQPGKAGEVEFQLPLGSIGNEIVECKSIEGELWCEVSVPEISGWANARFLFATSKGSALLPGQEINSAPQMIERTGCSIWDETTGKLFDAPNKGTALLRLPEGGASVVELYQGAFGMAVVGPKDWECFGWLRSEGLSLVVRPKGNKPFSRSPPIFGASELAIRADSFSVSRAGRIATAKQIAQFFSDLKYYVDEVQQIERVTFGQSAFVGFPRDSIFRRSASVVDFSTPAGEDGIGTFGIFRSGSSSVRGVAVLQSSLEGLKLRVIRARLGSSLDKVFTSVAWIAGSSEGSTGDVYSVVSETPDIDWQQLPGNWTSGEDCTRNVSVISERSVWSVFVKEESGSWRKRSESKYFIESSQSKICDYVPHSDNFRCLVSKRLNREEFSGTYLSVEDEGSEPEEFRYRRCGTQVPGLSEAVQHNAGKPTSESYGGDIRLSEVEIPFVGCKSETMAFGEVAAPTGVMQRRRMDPAAAKELAFYKAADGVGVLAPRGWNCFLRSGTAGYSLSVVPSASDLEVPKRGPKLGVLGPGVHVSLLDSGASGRWTAGRVHALLFPERRTMGNRWEDSYGNVRTESYPQDKLIKKSPTMVEFETPPSIEGIGTLLEFFRPSVSPISGVAILKPSKLDGDSILMLHVRLDPAQRYLSLPIVQQFEIANAGKDALGSSQSSPATTQDPNAADPLKTTEDSRTEISVLNSTWDAVATPARLALVSVVIFCLGVFFLLWSSSSLSTRVFGFVLVLAAIAGLLWHSERISEEYSGFGGIFIASWLIALACTAAIWLSITGCVQGRHRLVSVSISVLGLAIVLVPLFHSAFVQKGKSTSGEIPTLADVRIDTLDFPTFPHRRFRLPKSGEPPLTYFNLGDDELARFGLTASASDRVNERVIFDDRGYTRCWSKSKADESQRWARETMANGKPFDEIDPCDSRVGIAIDERTRAPFGVLYQMSNLTRREGSKYLDLSEFSAVFTSAAEAGDVLIVVPAATIIQETDYGLHLATSTMMYYVNPSAEMAQQLRRENKCEVTTYRGYSACGYKESKLMIEDHLRASLNDDSGGTQREEVPSTGGDRQPAREMSNSVIDDPRNATARNMCDAAEIVVRQALELAQSGVPRDTVMGTADAFLGIPLLYRWVRRSIVTAYQNPSLLREMLESREWTVRCINSVQGRERP